MCVRLGGRLVLDLIGAMGGDRYEDPEREQGDGDESRGAPTSLLVLVLRDLVAHTLRRTPELICQVWTEYAWRGVIVAEAFIFRLALLVPAGRALLRDGRRDDPVFSAGLVFLRGAVVLRRGGVLRADGVTLVSDPGSPAELLEALSERLAGYRTRVTL